MRKRERLQKAERALRKHSHNHLHSGLHPLSAVDHQHGPTLMNRLHCWTLDRHLRITLRLQHIVEERAPVHLLQATSPAVHEATVPYLSRKTTDLAVRRATANGLWAIEETHSKARTFHSALMEIR